VDIRDPLPAATLLQRSRAYAFSHSSQRLLETLGLWEALQRAMVPFRSLQLLDLAINQQVPFALADLGPRLAAAPGAAVGWVAQHRPLMTVLLERLVAHPAIRLELGSPPLAAECVAPADLIVAADGPHSPTRAALGIGAVQWAYRQNCLTALVQLRGSADDQAWELFRPEGPFAVLPLGEGLFQLVWSAPAHRCRQLESLGDAAFLDALAGALPDRFQPDALVDDPRAFPVSLLLARHLHRGSTVLVGESGHRCHPVGGQGLNLCWRDVAQLHRLARRVRAGRLEPARLPAAYARRRWPDLLLTLVATDLLVRVFSNRSPLLLPLRRLALLLLARLAPLRRLSLAAMTHGPCQLVRP
jgi:2-octaprenyl-6-methoxyphenol hydroxylase